jgi:hypothetical protein
VSGDAGVLSQLCSVGARFANATDSDITALRQAFAPVLQDLEQDAQTKTFIAEIERIKKDTGSGNALLIPDDCGRAAPGASTQPSPQPTKTTIATELDGMWEVTYTEDEFVAAHPDPSEVNPSNYGTFNLKFDRGDFTLGGTTGTYVVDGDTIAFYVPNEGSIWRYRWSVYRGTLTFEKLGGEEPGCSLSPSPGRCEPTGLVVKPWRLSR